MSPTAIDDATLEEFGPILIKQGYDWITMDKLDLPESNTSDDSDTGFLNKALICESWMEHHDKGVREQHDQLIHSGIPERQILLDYFNNLEAFMQEHEYRGCPFSQTAKAIKGMGEKGIEQKIREHKQEVRRFFQKLCRKLVFQPNTVAESLFLIYMGAMAESNDLMSLDPIHAGRKSAVFLYEKFQAA